MNTVGTKNMLSGNEANAMEESNLTKKPSSTVRALNEILKELFELYWVTSVAVIRRDGVLMASIMTQPPTTEQKNACALISATIVGAAKNITTKCRMGFPHFILIQAKEGDVIISEAGKQALLIVMVNERYHPALMGDEIQRAALAISTVV
jgi:predicted regulator of Ras-like GTPase activity (Roadblock/LC7/MglB family)